MSEEAKEKASEDLRKAVDDIRSYVTTRLKEHPLINVVILSAELFPDAEDPKSASCGPTSMISVGRDRVCRDYLLSYNAVELYRAAFQNKMDAEVFDDEAV